MAMARFISGALEILAALFFLKLGSVEAALRINALLGLIGPAVFIVVSVLGIVAMAVHLTPMKLILLTSGILLVLAGTRI
jgi:hypothetical protein